MAPPHPRRGEGRDVIGSDEAKIGLADDDAAIDREYAPVAAGIHQVVPARREEGA